MKLAMTGKGGVGKTTLSVCLARYLAEQGEDVILLDADPDADTALTLGLDDESTPRPISEMKDLIAERTGAQGTGGEFFSLNPSVEDVPDRFSVAADGVRLLRMGRLAQGGSGCFCPENAFLKSLLSHLFFGQQQYVILDMEAGIEHLGRGTAQGVDAMIVVVQPGRTSVKTAFSIQRYASDIGLYNIGAIVNNYRSEEQFEEVASRLGSLPVLGGFPYDEHVWQSDLDGTCPYAGTDSQRKRIGGLLSAIQDFVTGRKQEENNSKSD